MRGKPSEKAREFAMGDAGHPGVVGLVAGHDRSLGLDRSVCLRDVVEFVRKEGAWTSPKTMAVLLEREFANDNAPPDIHA